MKTMTKSILACAVALALVTVGTSQAKAGPWAVAAGVTAGVATGAVVGAAIASHSAPVYYGYPAPAYPGPVVVAPPVCYPRAVVVVPPLGFVGPGFRAGYWGPRYAYGYRGFRGYRRW